MKNDSKNSYVRFTIFRLEIGRLEQFDFFRRKDKRKRTSTIFVQMLHITVAYELALDLNTNQN